MKSFNDYVKIRESSLPPAESSASLIDSTESTATDRMFRLAWKKHESEVRSFLEKLSRNDPEIAAEYERIGKINNNSDDNNNPFGEKDVVRIHPMDTSGSGGFNPHQD